MKKRDMDIVVGGSILIGLLILVGSILWLKDLTVTSRLVEYSVLFPNVGTLQLGDPIMVNGVKKGVVGSIAIRKDSVVVVIKLDKEIVLTDSTRIVVQNIGLLGERMVGIQMSGKGTRFTPNSRGSKEPTAYIHGSFDTGIGEAMGMVGTVLGEVQVLVKDLSVIVQQTVGDSTFVTVFQNIVHRLDTVTVLAEALVKNNQGDINVAVDNLRAISAEVREIVQTNRTQIDGIIDNGEKLTVEALAITDGVDSIATSIRDLLGQIERGEGSLGQLVQDESFYRDLKTSIADVDTLVNEIKDDGLKLRVKLGFRKSRKARD